MVGPRRAAAVLLALAGVVALVGCGQLAAQLPSDRLQCDGTELELCRTVAALAVAQLNVQATGPITSVVLRVADCDQLARANFRSELAEAVMCWRVDVAGEDSAGGGLVGLWPDGDLRAFW